MQRSRWLVAAGFLAAAPVWAQQPAPAPAPPPPVVGTPLAVGAAAPAWSLMGGVRAGVTGPVSLADFQDKTLVIAFFFRARTRG